ncbi:MAG TPA: alpha/beta hydrolase [Euzebyales bacterium]
MKLTTFRKPDDERRFDEIYARLRAERWPSPPSETDVGTRLGTAHVFSWPGDGVPLLLLPGWGATSLMWAPMLVHGFGGRPVHCVDVIGDVGLSVQRAPIATLSDHLPWLDAVAVGLDLDRVHIVGSSYGALLTLVWAGRTPERVATATLLDPGGLVDIDMKRFIAWGMKVFAAAVAPMPIRRRAAERLHARMILDTDLFQLGRLANFATAHHDAPDAAAALPDAALRAVTSPTLALLAEHSAIMRPEAAAARARALLPDVTVEIVPDAGHGLPFDDAAVVAARVRRFLDAYGAGNRPATG